MSQSQATMTKNTWLLHKKKTHSHIICCKYIKYFYMHIPFSVRSCHTHTQTVVCLLFWNSRRTNFIHSIFFMCTLLPFWCQLPCEVWEMDGLIDGCMEPFSKPEKCTRPIPVVDIVPHKNKLRSGCVCVGAFTTWFPFVSSSSRASRVESRMNLL